MTRWHLRRLDTEHRAIDASGLSLRWLADKSCQQAADGQLIADGQPVALGALFEVHRDDDVGDPTEDELVVEGDLQCVHGLAARHARGCFTIRGNAGHYVAASMTGGTVRVQGNAGDFLAAPLGGEKVGMSGGRVSVSGNVGSHLAHRLRRGTLFIGGDAGHLAAASLVAGTVAIAGNTAGDIAVGMKRGTILLGHREGLTEGANGQQTIPAARFSRPFDFAAEFLRLYQTSILEPMLGRWEGRRLWRVRADRAVGGIGEVIFPQ
jgi:formylmethanofuran dehydrogenase subunit C